jgi:hypothetical protein
VARHAEAKGAVRGQFEKIKSGRLMMKSIIYMKRRPSRATFFVSPDGSRESARPHSMAACKPKAHGSFLLETWSDRGETSCELVPQTRQMTGFFPLCGDLMISGEPIAKVHIRNEMDQPLVRIESDTMELVAEREPFRDPDSPVYFKSMRHGVMAEASKNTFTLSELWRGRFGFGLARWGVLDLPDSAPTPGFLCAMDFTFGVYEFIV